MQISVQDPDGIVLQLWQEKTYNKKEYFSWVHRPIAQKSVRLFRCDALELMSKTPWFIVPIFWIPYICSIWYQVVDCSFYYCLLGLIVWPFLEYLFHRFLFHWNEDYFPTHKLFFCLHFILHGVHHLTPNDSNRLVMPPIMFWALMQSVRVFIMPILIKDKDVQWMIVSGSLVGYIYYDLLHYYLHHGKELYLFKGLRKHHHLHHYRNPNSQFGVSSRAVDFIFNRAILNF